MASGQSYYNAAAGSSTSSVVIAELTAAPTASANRYDGAFVFNVTKNQTRRVTIGGYDPHTGTLTVAPGWTAPTAGDAIEITRLFAVIEQSNIAGSSYLQIVNRALSAILATDLITVPIVGGATSYDVSLYGYWLDREERFGWPEVVQPDGTRLPQARLLEPAPLGGRPIPADWRRPRLHLATGVPALEIEAPFAAGTSGVMTMRVMRPGHTWINNAEDSNGLALVTDVALPSIEDVTSVGLLEAYGILKARGARTASGVNYETKWSQQLARCKQLKHFDWTLYTQSQTQVAPPATSAETGLPSYAATPARTAA